MENYTYSEIDLIGYGIVLLLVLILLTVMGLTL